MSGDMLSSSNNSSTETPDDSNKAPFSPSVTIVVGLLTSLLALLTIVGNSFTLIVFALSRSLRKFGDFFILNLAIADLAVGVMAIPPYIPFLLTGTWHGGMAFCKFWLLWDYVTSDASSWCICVISIDRYLLVVHPLLYRRIQSNRLQVIMLAIPWGATLLVYGPSIYLWELLYGPKIKPGDCDAPFADNVPFILFTLVFLFMLPYTLVAFTSVMICLSIRRRMFKKSNHLSTSSTLRSWAVVQDQDLSEKNVPEVEIFTIQSSTQMSPQTRKVSNVSQKSLITKNVVGVKGHPQMSPRTSKVSNVSQKALMTTTVVEVKGYTQMSPRTSKVSNVAQEALMTNNIIEVKGHTQMSPPTSKVFNVSQEALMTNKIVEVKGHTQMSPRTSKVFNVSQEASMTNVVEVKGHTQMSSLTSKVSNVSHKALVTNNVVEVKDHTKTSVNDIDNDDEATTELNLSTPQGSSTECTPDYSASVKASVPSFINYKVHERKDVWVALSLFVLVMVFSVCWIPYLVLELLMAVCHDCVNEDLYRFSFWLVWINSTVNPVLYPILHRRFRAAAAIVITGYCQCGSCRS